MLYVVATPIGNLEDISLRAIRVLREVDVIAAEDTRHTGKLLSAHSIETPVVAYHEHNEREAAAKLVARMQSGESMALVSDAGTPLLSDPGYRLVSAAIEAGVRVIPIPGSSAITAALSAAGLPTDRFCFEGFLAAKPNRRRAQLEALAREPRTLVFYEAPHRIRALLGDMADCFGSARHIVIARELTKQFEQLWSGDLAGALAAMDDGAIPDKGEFVVMVAGAGERGEQAGDEEVRRVMKILLDALPPATAATVASEILGVPRKRLYDIALALKKE